ncbi:hypothetical protein LTR85_006807 [Meristemomyces frigidus]|nr:hypothetical protein LTR85_006807 [Meristemomyces frigidus]
MECEEGSFEAHAGPPVHTRNAKRKADELESEADIPSERSSSAHPIKVTDNIDATEISQSAVLRLPAELRNIIYHYTLVQQTCIVIEAGDTPPLEPALLHVNRQVRREAIDMYYQQNEFEFTIANCDASCYLKWCKSTQRRKRSNLIWRFETIGNTNWPNLWTWLKAYYHDECYCIEEPESAVGEGDDLAIVRLFRIVRRMKREKASWEKVRKCLQGVHGVMAALRPERA